MEQQNSTVSISKVFPAPSTLAESLDKHPFGIPPNLLSLLMHKEGERESSASRPCGVTRFALAPEISRRGRFLQSFCFVVL